MYLKQKIKAQVTKQEEIYKHKKNNKRNKKKQRQWKINMEIHRTVRRRHKERKTEVKGVLIRRKGSRRG